MHHAFILTAFLAACSADQSFGERSSGNNTVGGDGKIEIFPADGVTCNEFDAGLTETCGFRVNSVGDYYLQLNSIQIVTAGENAGQPVFTNLRAADGSLDLPISINTGESAEFILQASMSEPGTATGEIEIATNDGSVSDPSPGKIRVSLNATALGNNDDDTGEEHADADDTGESGDDTGAAADGSDASDTGS